MTIQHLENATRHLDPAIIILNEFTNLLESEARRVAKNPALAPHFTLRVSSTFIPVLNKLCVDIQHSRDAVLAAEKMLVHTEHTPLPGNDR